jgi:hypothetical protein
MSNQYIAQSMDGYEGLLSSLPTYSKVNEPTPNIPYPHMRTPNNKYPNCSALMDDGRAFTDYRSTCVVNNMLRTQNKIKNSYEYRQFLINNGTKIMNSIRDYNINKTSCKKCDAMPISC